MGMEHIGFFLGDWKVNRALEAGGFSLQPLQAVGKAVRVVWC